MPWPFLLVAILYLTCSSNLCEARRRHHKLPSAVVVGTVYCDTCFQDDFSKGHYYISGATVAVECEQVSSRPAFYQEAKTDSRGTFKVSLPFSVSKHVKEIQGCNVKLVKSSEPYCAVASTASSSTIHIKEKTRDNNKHVFSAGFFTFKPLKQPGLCNQKTSTITNSKLNSGQSLFLDPVFPAIPSLPFLPQLPNLPPLPSLPSLPPYPTIPRLPGLPFPSKYQKPIGFQSSKEKKVENGQVSQPQFFFFPPIVSPPSTFLPPNPLQPAPLLPNPLQPPPSPLIPNPFQPPTPPPSLLPPLPPLPNLPPTPVIPGLTPTPSPPPPVSSFPFPQVPFPPFPPLIPGIPPASGNSKKVHP